MNEWVSEWEWVRDSCDDEFCVEWMKSVMNGVMNEKCDKWMVWWMNSVMDERLTGWIWIINELLWDVLVVILNCVCNVLYCVLMCVFVFRAKTIVYRTINSMLIRMCCLFICTNPQQNDYLLLTWLWFCWWYLRPLPFDERFLWPKFSARNVLSHWLRSCSRDRKQ